MKKLVLAFAALAVASPALAQDAPASSQVYTDVCDPQAAQSEACADWNQAPAYDQAPAYGDETRGDFSGGSEAPLSLTDEDWSDQ